MNAPFSEIAVGMHASWVHSSVGAGWALEAQAELKSSKKVIERNAL